MPPNDDAALLAAHAARDGDAIVRLYREAAEAHEARGDVDQACFYFTQAYIWALEAGHPETGALHTRLKARGRDA